MMPFSYFDKYVQVPDNNNGSPPTGAPENMAPADVNNTMRQSMAALAESHDSYSVLLTDNPSGDLLVPTPLPAAAWTFDYTNVAYTDVAQGWSETQTFNQGIVAGETADNEPGVVILGNTSSTLSFTTSTKATTLVLDDTTGNLVTATTLEVAGLITGAVVASGNVSGVDGNFSGNVSGVDGVFSGNVSGANVTATDLLKASRIDIGSPSTPAGPNDGAIEGDLLVDGAINAASFVTDSIQTTGGAEYLNETNYAEKAIAVFTSAATLTMPADSGKFLDPAGATSIAGTPVQGNRVDIFNNTGGDVVISAAANFSGFGNQLGNNLTVPDGFGASAIYSGTVWYVIGAGSIA